MKRLSLGQGVPVLMLCSRRQIKIPNWWQSDNFNEMIKYFSSACSELGKRTGQNGKTKRGNPSDRHRMTKKESRK
jgi:hypothetical protein